MSPTPPAAREAATLRGPDHPDLGQRHVRAIGEDAAVGLSAGRHPKAVAAVDPNEDAAAAVVGSAAAVLLVADGHIGSDAAVAAVETCSEWANKVVGDATIVKGASSRLADALDDAAQAVAQARQRAQGPRRDSATALSVAVLARRTLWTATLGDTAVVRIRGQRARTVSRSTAFLSGPGPLPRARRVGLREGDAVVLVSDGVVDYLGRRWETRLAELTAGGTPAQAVDAVLEAAMNGGAGDHLSCAYIRVRT